MLKRAVRTRSIVSLRLCRWRWCNSLPPFGGRRLDKGREPVRARRSFNLAFRHATEPSTPCRKRVACSETPTSSVCVFLHVCADGTRKNTYPVKKRGKNISASAKKKRKNEQRPDVSLKEKAWMSVPRLVKTNGGKIEIGAQMLYDALLDMLI